jgi:mono/diheme cytochrome c family protein
MFLRHIGALLASSSVFLVTITALTLLSCAQEQYPAALWAAEHPSADGGANSDATVSDPPPEGPAVCRQAHAEPLPARLEVTSGDAGAGGVPVYAIEIYAQALSLCGRCHEGENPSGNFSLTSAADLTPAVLEHVTGAKCPMGTSTPQSPGSPTDPMPPCYSGAGGTYDPSDTTAPLVVFATQTQEWLNAGSPASFTAPSSSSGSATTAAGYTLTTQLANALTNLGNCVPSPALLSFNSPRAVAMDAMFAAAKSQSDPPSSCTGACAAQMMIGLPLYLSQTDLYTLDSAALAQDGVVAYAPGYPLWSDSAGKLRYVRVPRGTSIHFDKATQKFEIPPNTRFYKTFMKEVVDTDGSYRFRKIETRLIVSRPDQNNPDGTAAAQTALFGSYQWNADETEATLITTPLTNGLPFADTIVFYYTDENLAQDLLKNPGSDPEAMLVANNPPAGRHWAIPSSERCIQCHMGSPSQAFVLGFTPLQINRFPVGTHGVIPSSPGTFGGPSSAVGADELTQLQRFIDLGIITGIDSPSDVLPLEQSQGSRTYRTPEELIAQGYMLGNCAHCHNPRGLPSVQNPLLAPVLDFLPSAEGGGVFQFPLERYSPVIGRGPSGSTPIPYITPSLVDLPRIDPSTGQPAEDVFIAALEGAAPNLDFVVYAPWRSLIYRNTDNAFAYQDDIALFPHMPVNTAGFDPRARQILGNWMVSLPAARKHPDLLEYAYQLGAQAGPSGSAASYLGSPIVDTEPQPYVEVLPGQAGYEAAIAAAQARLNIWQSGENPALSTIAGSVPFVYSRYDDPGETDDIFDPAVLANPTCQPVPIAQAINPKAPTFPIPPPGHPHWVSSDLTQPPGPWYPRQATWPSVLVEAPLESQFLPSPPSTCLVGQVANQAQATTNAYADQLVAIGLLSNAFLSDVNGTANSNFATTPRPYGLWQQQPGCTFPTSGPSAVPTVSSFTGANRPHWMDVANLPLNSTAPVYMATPGEAVFKMICIDCHGPLANGLGPQALNLATMTGGLAFVADWRDGLLGPVGASELQSNRHSIFGTTALQSDIAALMLAAGAPPIPASWLSPEATDDDRASRYMAWMGLGGTHVVIPEAILQIVSVTPVFGLSRVVPATQLSANMLSEAKAICLSQLGPSFFNDGSFTPGAGQGYFEGINSTGLNTVLLPTIGDAEMWLSMCTTAAPSPIHVLHFNNIGGNGLAHGLFVSAINQSVNPTALVIQPGTLLASESYPAGTPVGNANGSADSSLLATNVWPWCVDDTDTDDGTDGNDVATPAEEAQLTAACGTNAATGAPNCVCPESVKAQYHACYVAPAGSPLPAQCWGNDEANQWAVRGAISAGASIYLYAQSIENSTPAPDYNQCSLLPQ